MNERRMLVPLLIGFALAWQPAATAQAPAAKQDPGANAALKYWQGFGQLPTPDKEQEKLLQEWKTAPLDAAALKLIASSEPSLLYLHRGAKLPRCDWALDYEDGPMLLMPHLHKARLLMGLAVLRARREFTQGETQAGVEDAVATLVLSRHVEIDTIMINILVGYAGEHMAIDVLAEYLPKLDAAARKDLAGRLDALPPPGSPAKAVLTEKEFTAGWVARKVREGARKGTWKEELAKLWGSEGAAQALPKELDSATPEKVLQMLDELKPLYDEMSQVMALPPDQFGPRHDALEKKLKDANPMARLLLPAGAKVVAAQWRGEARMAMLKAAVAVAQGGPDKVKTIRDPFGQGPFEYRELPGGFELKSKLTYQDKPVTLTVGQGKKE
jgi:hypothetical protein